jgi:hypothetical protein
MLNVEAMVHYHNKAQEDGDAFWLLGKGGNKESLKQQSTNCACGAAVA